MVDYREELVRDLVEQFKGKPIIEALVVTIGEQLNEVRDFFEALRTERSVKTAVGKQLDGIGDIVCMSRYDATELASTLETEYSMSDDKYRNYLMYKIWKNSGNCTYYDVVKSIKMFWKSPLYYSEDPDKPATMIFNTDILPPSADTSALLSTPIIRAAGVKIQFVINSGGIGTAETYMMAVPAGSDIVDGATAVKF